MLYGGQLVFCKLYVYSSNMLATVCQDTKVENQVSNIWKVTQCSSSIYIWSWRFTLQTDRYNIHSQLEHRKFTNSQ